MTLTPCPETVASRPPRALHARPRSPDDARPVARRPARTRTYARRGWFFLASEDGTVTNPKDPAHAVPAAGRLVIACGKQTKKSATVEVDEYAVQPVPTGTRSQVAYLLAKLGPAGDPADVYEVSGGVNGRRCTCPAGASGKPCKHLAAGGDDRGDGGLPGPKK